MFGYVNIFKPELRVREFDTYQSFYCGLCRELKKRYGRIGQFTLSYDMTFLILLLTSLYEQKSNCEQKRCLAHPAKRRRMRANPITSYAADMNIALMYYKCLDDWQDDHSLKGLLLAAALKVKYRKVRKQYPRQCREIIKALKQLRELENRQETDLDKVLRPFGELMGELFVYQEDHWQTGLRRLGFFLGKFIYLMDAFEDLPEDKENGSYNPLIFYSGQKTKKEWKEWCEALLTMMMSECTKEFERLPLVYEAELLRNILYSGVWVRFDKKRKTRKSAERNS